MRVVLGTYSSNAEINGGCEFAVVDLTPTYAKRIQERMRVLLDLAKNDRSLHEAHYWDADAM